MTKTIAVVGLGYVGLPLAVEFGKYFQTIGFDVSAKKIMQLNQGIDLTGELAEGALAQAKLLSMTSDPLAIQTADFIVIAVPTPVDIAHKPDFTPLISASEIVGSHLKQGAIVVYESTVYPGATEEICVPVLERCSGKKWKKDFFVGYSPERINPSDKVHTLTNIVKIVSGDTAKTLAEVADVYGQIITAGVFAAASIKEAEAAKVIENTQRDLNIALMNELAIIFDRLGIDTLDVLKAAGSKWNFLPFRPGLVGGHCIGVDPYYLTHKAEMMGYHPQVILAGRRINDNMGRFIAEKTVKKILHQGVNVAAATVCVLGLTFKENCSDLRNSKVVDILDELRAFHVGSIHVYDPMADREAAQHEYGIDLCDWDQLPVCDALIVAVAHDAYAKQPLDYFLAKMKLNACLIDVKSIFDRDELKKKKIAYWRL
ncbi:MAG: GDP-mannose dehydrogenase [Gammaproteobacteria bacterium GWE2_42_36]|nr:MAG: GDP-mannose dehydrogenase [Gammaproteobacteria bacterium GWE2_42_36]